MTSACLQQLLDRVSTKDLSDPAPSADILEKILSAGLCAPHHGRIKPWKWIVIQGNERKKLAQLIKEASVRAQPDISDEKLAHRVSTFENTPLVIGLGGMFEESRIPMSDQRYAVAAGAMNILNALHAEGFGGIWLTGALCEDAQLIKALGLQTEGKTGELLGFLLAGTPKKDADAPAKKRPDLHDHVLYWSSSI